MTAAELPQRGRNKAKRHDLRQVGLALLVTADFHIPLLHQVYPGNDPDAVQFGHITEDLMARYRLLSQHCQDITLIFDKGNNSADNIRDLDESPYHFVGSLTPAQYADLLAIPREQFQPLQHVKCAGVWAYRTRRKVLGQERTVVVTYSEELYQGQVQGLTQHLRKATSALRELQQRLLAAAQRRRGQQITKAPLEQQVRRICSAQHLKEVL